LPAASRPERDVEAFFFMTTALMNEQEV